LQKTSFKRKRFSTLASHSLFALA